MKKLPLVIGVLAATASLWSCEDTPENPGDFNLKAEITMGSSFTAISDPSRIYPLKEADRRDTVYKYKHELVDTVFEYSPDGKDSTYVYGPDGKPLVNKRDTFVLSKKTATLIEYEPVIVETFADTIVAEIYSNARWTAKQPDPVGAQWLYNYNSSQSGGGDSKLGLRSARSRSKNQRGPVYQYIFTSDSMTCIVIPFYQKGTSDN